MKVYENESFKAKYLFDMDFSNCLFKSCDFTDAKLDGSNFTESIFDGCTFTRTYSTNIDFSHTGFYNCTLERFFTRGCNFDNSNLKVVVLDKYTGVLYNDQLEINCMKHPYSYFKDNYLTLGAEAGLSPEKALEFYNKCAQAFGY